VIERLAPHDFWMTLGVMLELSAPRRQRMIAAGVGGRPTQELVRTNSK
jgi:hypothetical protein